jgi:type-F conjugative transfer system pilin assembly protein TrbC
MLLIIFTSLTLLSADIFNSEEHERFMDQVDQYKQSITTTDNGYPHTGTKQKTEEQKKVDQAAQQLQKTFTAKEFQGKILEYKNLLQEQIQGPEQSCGKCTGNIDMAPPGSGILDADERIYVFISSSVPENTIRGYVSDIDKLQDPNVFLVMRGFIGGMKYFRPTLSFMTGLLKKDKSCSLERGEKCEVYQSQFQIDPMLFARYDITSVPAIVYARGLSINDSDMSEGLMDNANISNAYVIYGDTSLEYALERFYRETNSSTILSAIKQLRKGFY